MAKLEKHEKRINIPDYKTDSEHGGAYHISSGDMSRIATRIVSTA